VRKRAKKTAKFIVSFFLFGNMERDEKSNEHDVVVMVGYKIDLDLCFRCNVSQDDSLLISIKEERRMIKIDAMMTRNGKSDELEGLAHFHAHDELNTDCSTPVSIGSSESEFVRPFEFHVRRIATSH
jgi:hypothetical protein